MIAEVDRVKYPLPQKKSLTATIIDKADEVVDIRDILKEMGVWVPSGTFHSYKIFCPWHFEHADQLDKNCRLFGSTNIYCWAMHGRINPTQLYARWKGMSRKRAAKILLEERGLLNKPWRAWWNELIVLREDRQHKNLGSQMDAVSALHLRLEHNQEYLEHEFDVSVRAAWNDVLLALDRLWELPDANFEYLAVWIDRSLTKIENAVTLCSD